MDIHVRAFDFMSVHDCRVVIICVNRTAVFFYRNFKRFAYGRTVDFERYDQLHRSRRLCVQPTVLYFYNAVGICYAILRFIGIRKLHSVHQGNRVKGIILSLHENAIRIYIRLYGKPAELHGKIFCDCNLFSRRARYRQRQRDRARL